MQGTPPTQPIESPFGGGAPTPNPFDTAEKKPRSRTPMLLAGCGCAILLGCGGLGALVVGLALWAAPGEAIATSPETALGAPVVVRYRQEGETRYRAWLEVDVTGGYRVQGRLLLKENGEAFGEYVVDDDGEGSPVEGRSSTRFGWTRINDHQSGTVSLFPLPARTDQGIIEVAGTLSAPAGTTGTVRLFVTER